MPNRIRFHLDENVSNAIADGLRRRAIDVTTTSGAKLMAATDEAQLEFARSQGRVIFTQDADFLRLHQMGVNHVGIVYCMQGNRSIGEIVRGLILIWELLEPDEMIGHVEFL